jgi:hypothetical protein
MLALNRSLLKHVNVTRVYIYNVAHTPVARQRPAPNNGSNFGVRVFCVAHSEFISREWVQCSAVKGS